MTHRKSQTVVTKMMIGLAIGATIVGAGTVRAETDQVCFSAVVDLYLAERASASLDYVVCKTTCHESVPSDRGACRRECLVARAEAVRASRGDAEALQAVCNGGGAATQQATAAAAPVPSTCGPDLSDCAAEARIAAKTCDRTSTDLATLSECAAAVSDAVDQCAANFVDCAAPAEQSPAQ